MLHRRLTAPALHEVIGELLQAFDEGRHDCFLDRRMSDPPFSGIFYLVTLQVEFLWNPDGLAVTLLNTFAFS